MSEVRILRTNIDFHEGDIYVLVFSESGRVFTRLQEPSPKEDELLDDVSDGTYVSVRKMDFDVRVDAVNLSNGTNFSKPRSKVSEEFKKLADWMLDSSDSYTTKQYLKHDGRGYRIDSGKNLVSFIRKSKLEGKPVDEMLLGHPRVETLEYVDPATGEFNETMRGRRFGLVSSNLPCQNTTPSEAMTYKRALDLLKLSEEAVARSVYSYLIEESKEPDSTMSAPVPGCYLVSFTKPGATPETVSRRRLEESFSSLDPVRYKLVRNVAADRFLRRVSKAWVKKRVPGAANSNRWKNESFIFEISSYPESSRYTIIDIMGPGSYRENSSNSGFLGVSTPQFNLRKSETYLFTRNSAYSFEDSLRDRDFDAKRRCWALVSVAPLK